MKVVAGLARVSGMFRCNRTALHLEGKTQGGGTFIPSMKDLARAANAYSPKNPKK